MRWDRLGAVAICCSCAVAASGGEGAAEDATKELAALGVKAKDISTLYLVAHASFEQPSAPEDRREKPAVLLVWYDKANLCLRTDEVKEQRVTTCLVNQHGAFQWIVNRKNRAPAGKAFRWPREHWLPSKGNELRSGAAVFFLDALNCYEVLTNGFAIARAKEPALPLDDTTWFTATPKPGGPFAKGGEMSLRLGVDNKTGLLVAMSSEARGARVNIAIVSVEVNPTIRDAFLVPNSVRAVGIRDARTGKDIELPGER
ncbi:MAG: hypothetical protein FJ290_19395 [Planctomycetes bacterium]|nr:hypothetical protein [Planctomycetota bacterium]